MAILFLFAYCGLAMVALPQGGVESGPALVWPAAGLLVAILLHAPRAQWPIFLALAGAGSGGVALLMGGGPVIAAILAVVHVLEAWIAARLLRRRKRREAELLREWLADAAAIGAVAPIVAGLVLATLMYRIAGWPWQVQFTRYVFAHALGIMAFFPMFSLLIGGGFASWYERQNAGRRLEVFAFLGLTALTTCAALWQAGLAAYLVPILIALIAICRFGMKAASMAVFTIAVAGWGAYVAGTQVTALLPLEVPAGEHFLQFYFAVTVICLQPLAGHLTQNRQLASALKSRGEASTAVELSLQAKDFAIAESQRMYRLLAENMSDIVLKTDREGYILYASPSAEKLGETHAIELIGRNVLDLIHPSYAASFQSEFDSVVGGGTAASSWHEFLGSSSAGGEHWFDTRIRVWRGEDHNFSGTIITLRGIAERKALEQQLFAAILTDPLTNLTNRRAFNSMLQYHLEAPIEGCLAIFDIDDFRSINREYGHETGDKVLTTVARLLRSLMRKDDIISRIGGERFAVLLSGANPDQAEALCQRVVMTLADISGPEGMGGPKTTVSAGVARIRGTLDETMKRADAAVVIAKAKGRNRLEMATGTRQRWSPGQVPWIEG
ncbi:MAG: diguanylate cyclase [Candidatus Andeanibacterium colombiense]|uniref:Diguanylate cyclase n=1 Tax=Candidatus Andeanibacterium colombiense TaxID=3121345 RepID=A0AAJ6BP47_9SPHN|nr:MAG: diguanylate cyclase [Sphingomonadaceae bacterium]